MREYQWYCPKCGFKSFLLKSDNGICTCCGSQMKESPSEYNLTQQQWMKLSNIDWEQNEQHLFDEVISKSPEFDINLYNNKDSILQQKQQQQKESINRGKAILEEQSCQPECPTCHSKNIQRISGLERGTSIAILGLFSKKINKSFKCKNCGYTW